jgi:hypothetical protein
MSASNETAPPEFLTPQELALRWRMSVRSLDRWRAQRFGPAWLQIGGAIRYALADVVAYEARRRRPTR